MCITAFDFSSSLSNNRVVFFTGDKQMKTVCNKYSHRSCGNGWIQLDQDRCMKFFSTPMTFEKAEVIQTHTHTGTTIHAHLCADSHGEDSSFSTFQEKCYDSDGHLVSIHDEQQRIRVDCLAWRSHKGRKPFWIGAKARKVRNKCLGVGTTPNN